MTRGPLGDKNRGLASVLGPGVLRVCLDARNLGATRPAFRLALEGGGWFSLLMATVPYGKPYLAVSEQLDLLEARGLELGDRDLAAEWLRRVGYYRLSGYWYPFRESDRAQDGRVRILDTFASGTTLRMVTELYEFDRALRLLVLDGVERLEVSIRFHVGHVLGRRGPYAHADPAALSAEFTGGPLDAPHAVARWRTSDHAAWLARRAEEERRSKTDFTKHILAKYGPPLPVWVVTEILDFGGLSRLYAGLLQRDRDQIAASLGLFDASGAGNGGALQDWLKNINVVRNVCAHHGRLWNANVTERLSPTKLRAIDELTHIGARGANARIYPTLAVMALLISRVHPEDDWAARLVRHISTLPAQRSESEMGFPDLWRDEGIWRGGGQSARPRPRSAPSASS